MGLTRLQLLRLTTEQLDDLFRASPAGELPEGEGTGTAIICPGGWWAKFWAWVVRCFAWQGKVFHGRRGSLVNRVTAFSIPAIEAEVYLGESWLDGKECIVLDYSRTSFIAKKVRDEIREVAPGLYLGKVWWKKKRLIDFSVSFQYEPRPKLWRRVWATAALAVLIFGIYMAARISRDEPVTYASEIDHFKYGSAGGERDAGIPLAIWKVLPAMFPEHLPPEAARWPKQPLRAIGFVYEGDKELPVGVSQRTVQGIERVFVNCAVCHVGTVRDTPESASRVYAGMPSNTVDLESFERFLFNCAADERFTPERVMLELRKHGIREDFINRQLFRWVAIGRMRDRLLLLRDRFLSFMDREPECGPGRVDTFNPPKVLLNFRMDQLPREEWVGLCDFPSIWLQGKREGMQLHWDGNNTSVAERNRSAAFGTGALPTTLDRESMRRTERWLKHVEPPKYPYPIDQTLAAKGAPLYAQFCARCHGKDGRDFTGDLVGKVTPIDAIKTDRARLDSYTADLAANQNLLYAGYPEERFKHFRKTYGYANQPLDGVWLRAPYLHNGSVPTLRELLEPATNRSAKFQRGYDVYDPKNVGFISTVGEENGRTFFTFDTSLPGNGNQGHEGPEYGTELSSDAKDAIVEFMKTF